MASGNRDRGALRRACPVVRSRAAGAQAGAEQGRRLLETSLALEAANQELEAFSYSVAHDLRAPLRAVGGFSEILLEDYGDKLDDEGRQYLHDIDESAQTMAHLIDDLLSLARVSRSELHRQRVDLSEIARSVAVRLRNSEPERRVEFAIADGLGDEGDAGLLSITPARGAGLPH